MNQEKLRAIYKMGNLTNKFNSTIVALALMEQEGTGFIRITSDGFDEFERIAGLEPGGSDFYLNELSERDYLVWHSDDIVWLNWEKITKEMK